MTDTKKEYTIRNTRSVCPQCLRQLPADILRREAGIVLRRVCPDHGLAEAVIWRGAPDFERWKRPKVYNSQFLRQSQRSAGCPHDCGLCGQHLQKSCAVLYELTPYCNLRCPVCFASAESESARGTWAGKKTGGQTKLSKTGELGVSGCCHDTLDEHLRAVRWIHGQAGHAVLQISGGEPTLSPFLIPLIREAKQLFPAVQLNTNGILLGAERTEFRRQNSMSGRGLDARQGCESGRDLAFELAGAGLDWVFLQFDGTNDAIYEKLRGKALLQIKLRAIEHCREAGLAVVLVPTVARGINDHDLGNIVRLAMDNVPTVRGVHFQPMTRSGRNELTVQPGLQRDLQLDLQTSSQLCSAAGLQQGLTLPEVLQSLEQQTDGLVRIEHASPPGCEHERCSFHCRYTLRKGALVHTPSSCCCAGAPDKADYLKGTPESSEAGANRAIESVVRRWQKAPGSDSMEQQDDSFDAFIAQHRATVFSITCMAFQDIWNLDLQRLQGCCIHVYARPDRLVPFCAYNLTDATGKPLYRSADG